MWSLLLKHDELEKLKRSKFRRNWYLDELDKKRALTYGFVELEKHARAIIEERLRIKPADDGKQTPYKGHPVFKAMHATATCCRKCLFSWHRIPPYKTLEEQDLKFITRLIIRWIANEVSRNDGTLNSFLISLK